MQILYTFFVMQPVKIRLLSEMAEIRPGFAFKPGHTGKSGKYLVFKSSNIKNGRLVLTGHDRYVAEINEPGFEDAVLGTGDAVISLVSKPHEICIYSGGPPAAAGRDCAVIRSKNNPYIKAFLSSAAYRLSSLAQAKGPPLSVDKLGRVRIPVLPLDDLNIIGQAGLTRLGRQAVAQLIQTLEQITDEPPPSVAEEPAAYMDRGAEADIRQLKNEMRVIKKFVEEILTASRRMEHKIDHISEKLNTLAKDIETVRLTQRNEEEKIRIIYAKIDRTFGPLKQELGNEVDIYVDILKDLIDNWDQLETLSREILPVAEYLFDKLAGIENADYSPVILQYCKCLEHEILKKLFVEFTISIASKYPDLDDRLAQDLENAKARLFAKYAKKYKNSNQDEIKYTLGEMSFILNLSTSRTLVRESFIFREFRDYIVNRFKSELLLSRDYLERINLIVNDFRNKCAHPYRMKETDARTCKKAIPRDIDDFVDYWKEKAGRRTEALQSQSLS